MPDPESPAIAAAALQPLRIPALQVSPSPLPPSQADRDFNEFVQQHAVFAKPSEDARDLLDQESSMPTDTPEAKAFHLRVLEFASKLAAMDALLEPGQHAEGLPDRMLMPCGKCDGVFWLQQNILAQQQDQRREAMRYLRPMPPHWHRLMGNIKPPADAKERNPNKAYARNIGVCKPHGLDVPWIAQIDYAARAQGRNYNWMFVQEPHCIDAVQPAYVLRWRCYRVADAVWAVLYV